MQNLSTRIRHWILAATCAVAASGAWAQPAREISMGLASTSFATAAPRIAKELGLFARQGLDPKFTVLENANQATSALIAKSVDSALSGPGELIVSQSRGQKVVVVANAYSGFSGTVVLAKPVADKLGIAPGAPASARLKALDGMTIASPSATGAYTIALKAAAAAAGANVRFTYMAQPAMIAAMESGAIQGFIGGAPLWATPVLKGSGVAWLSGPKGEFPAEHIPGITAHLQVMRSFAEANPDLVKKLADVFADLTRAINERPAEVRAAVGRLYPNIDPATLNLLFSAESLAWRAKPLSAKDIAHEIAFVKLLGIPLPQIDSVDPAALLFP